MLTLCVWMGDTMSFTDHYVRALGPQVLLSGCEIFRKAKNSEGSGSLGGGITGCRLAPPSSYSSSSFCSLITDVRQHASTMDMNRYSQLPCFPWPQWILPSQTVSQTNTPLLMLLLVHLIGHSNEKKRII